MTDHLLPCPFCGSTNLRYVFTGSQGYIECNECGTEGPCDERAADPRCDIEAAQAAWNRRTQPESKGLTDDELMEAWGLPEYEALSRDDIIASLRNVLARWGSQAQPVSVTDE